MKPAIIKNRAELALTPARKDILDIIEAGISRVLPSEVLQSALKYDRLTKNLYINADVFPVAKGRIFVIGGGKASGFMAETLEEILGSEMICDGIINCKDDTFKGYTVKIVTAGHPFPDENGVNGVKSMLALKDQYSVGKDDLVLCLISGGGSALIPYPVDGVNLQDKQTMTRLLLNSGAEINEINVVRKHLSQVKGGRLGLHFSPATVISLILSDVVGNDISVIASGPTVPDRSTFSEAYQVLENYHLLADSPATIVEYFQKGCLGLVEETPKILNNCHNYIIGDNMLALKAMAQKAHDKGYRPCIITAEQKGNASDAAWERARQVISTITGDYDLFVLGGETTLRLPQSVGRGGRNQHFTAVSLLAMKDLKREWVVASVGTDGSDYLPEVAGAVIDNHSLERLASKNIDPQDYISRFDSNTLLAKTGNALIITGNTGTNVGDIVIYLIKQFK